VCLFLLVFGCGLFVATPEAEARTLARDVATFALGVLARSMNSGQSSKPPDPPSEAK
jgi:hypothetical protein